MYRILLIFIVGIIGLSGCGGDTAENTNSDATPVANENVNGENVNANQEPEEVVAVPEFDDAEKALKQGVEYLDDNKFENAIIALRQAVELDKDLADAHFQLGVALSLKDSEEEKIVPDEILDDDATPEPKKKEKKKESEVAFENAVKAYKKVVAKDRKNHTAYFNLGRSYVKLFDDKEARKALERAVKLNGEDATYRTELGSVLIKLAQYPIAIRQLNKALALDDTNYRAEDLLDKAKAGKKRVGHKKTPKPRTVSSSSSKSSSSSSSSATSRPRVVSKPKDAKADKKEDKKN